MCNVLKISRSCYYRWYTSKPGKRYKENQQFTGLIKQEFELSKKRYGSSRIAKSLQSKGYKISSNRVAKLMKINNWRSITKKQFKVTTDSNHKEPTCKNVLNRDFKMTRLNQAWVSDITYIKTNTGWLYLTTVIDLYDRQVVGWALSITMHTNKTIIPAWKMAVSKRTIEEPLIFHSDRGIQYACKEFRNLLKTNSLITQSMSRKGNCWDNAVAESFFKTIKTEMIYHNKFKNQSEAKTAVFEYIEVWYNRKRLHSSLNYKIPYQMELEFYNKFEIVA